MKKPKITPGEWDLVRSDNRPDGEGSKHTYDIVVGADDLIYANGICTVWQINQQDDSETIANAKAIAQVPNLIEALKDVIDLASDAVSTCGGEPEKERVIHKGIQTLIKAGYEL